MFSGLLGLGQNCFHKKQVGQFTPPNRVAVGVAALLDVIASVAMALLIVFGSKIGVNIPTCGQWALGAAAALNILLLLHRNIIPVEHNFLPLPQQPAV